MKDTTITEDRKLRLHSISCPVIKWKYGTPAKEMQYFVYLEGVENLTTIQLSINGE